MRPSRTLAVLAPVVLAAMSLGDTSACNAGNSAAALDAGGAVDAPPDYTRPPYDGLPAPDSGPRVPVHAEFVSTRADTEQLMFAAGEMQTSGEPFASNFAGRNLADYDRYVVPPNQYIVNVSGTGGGFSESFIDLFGFSTAVESYEYSKYHMNMVANQTGAGVSLANGPLIAMQPGATPRDKLRTRIVQLVSAAGTDVGGFTFLSGDAGPDNGSNPLNDLGFRGIWPNLAAYKTFDPSMTPTALITGRCTTVTGYGGVQQFGNNPVPVYECDYNSLRLDDRVAQTEPVIGPGILGYTTWKEALWGIDFTGRLHDSQANPVTGVAPGDIPSVGLPGNKVQAVEPPTAAPGVFIGSTPLEGMWGLTMVDEMDNAGAWLVSSLGTSDGATLGGFSSVAQAIQYDYASPLVWFPTAIAVTEANSGCVINCPWATYPAVTALAIQDATSRSVDLSALARGYSLFFGMSDSRNVAVGQQLGMSIAFSGSPFASDDGLPDGEDTPHDRALAIMRVAFVDLDRIHSDPATGIVADTATIDGGGNITRGTGATTTALGHVVVGLRHLLMACNASVSQYGAPDGDPTKDALGILNSVPIHPTYDVDGGSPPLFSARVRQVLMTQARFVRDTLTQSDGTVANGATLANGMWTPTTDPTTLEAQGAAVRMLGEAWFLTHDSTYLARGRAVAGKLLTAFWSAPARMFRATAGGPDDVVMSPERFAWLQQALRETYEAMWVPGDPLLDRAVLEDRIARVNKLYLNGWDDLNGDQLVQRSECLSARMQLGEQALTGELGKIDNGFVGSTGGDRDADCVPNITAGKMASVLASQVHFHSP